MIKRKYFFSCQCPYQDDSGSYSFYSTLVTVKSFLIDENELYEELRKQAIENFKSKGIENPSLDIQAFNRV